MSRALLAGQSGWGKSWMCQWWIEDNVTDYDYLVIADYKDEYRGLSKTDGGLPASKRTRWVGVEDAVARLSVDAWERFLQDNPRVQLARAVDEETWQTVVAKVARAIRRLEGTALIVIDEAHFVAPGRGSIPDEIKGLATTGRGEGVSTVWVTQRLQEANETILSQTDIRLLGGFSNDNDEGKIGRIVDYNPDVHNPGSTRVRVPEAIDRDGEPVQKFYDDTGQLVGSEWIWSTTSGDLDRIDTRDLELMSTHYGGEDQDLSKPG